MSIKDTFYAALSTDAMPGIFEFQSNNSRALRPSLQDVSKITFHSLTWLCKIVKSVHMCYFGENPTIVDPALILLRMNLTMCCRQTSYPGFC